MKRYSCTVVALLLACTAHAERGDSVSHDLSLLCNQPEVIGSDAYDQAVRTLNECFPEKRIQALALPEGAWAWCPSFGPCGGPGSPLLIAFLASLAREPASAPKAQAIHRAWVVVLKHYTHFRKTLSNDEFPVIPALEDMARKEKAGLLLAEATALCAAKPERSPAPTVSREARHSKAESADH